jgi:hypothetical protein
MKTKLKRYVQFISEAIDMPPKPVEIHQTYQKPQDKALDKDTYQFKVDTVGQDGHYSEVFRVDSLLTKTQIKNKITTYIYNNQTGITITTNAPDKITCKVSIAAKPDGANGTCTGDMTVSFKDGRYKVEISNIQFVYSGMQPQTTTPVGQIGQNIGRQLTNVATTAITGQIKNPILRNMARQTTTTLSQNQVSPYNKSILTYQDALDSNTSFVNSVDSEISKITTNFYNLFSSDTQNDW